MKHAAYLTGGGLVCVLAGAAAWWWWPSALPLAQAPPAVEVAPSAADASPTSEPAIRYPIAAPPDSEPATAAAMPKLSSALTDLFGRQAVLSLLQTEGFPARVVATVDNLGRNHAAPRLWPVNPTPGRFLVDRQGASDVIALDNASRYTPFVLFVEQVDLRRAVALYTRFYPQFQAAFEELGYPTRHFNDRLVEVIDQLLATPEPGLPLQVQLPVIHGPVKPVRPWVMYEFDDPALQSLSAGQKILVRMGPAHQRSLKSRLLEIRSLLTAGTAPR